MRAEAAEAGTDDRHLRAFADFVAGQPGHDLTYEDLTGSATRAELGIGSLDMLILIAGYIESRGADGLSLQPEWVPLLDDVAGLRTVLAEIDAATGSRSA
ncbi:hypothetical protein [Actinomycetospora sp. NBRC 106378]|jgi:hypothetical protein|uniref:hypothetical protein n=1 Tax=Actinomycetospora sp. NBRC 106378 TaxID=3032208 RepID=UPI0024A4715C|nr:hypothetical protein [Actinomycetospora sp. NBRC 106378]GLZ51891.1 hypothetical protein Acsp07_15080 [Actinomycetospora sp. NBRC 106378]